MCSSVLAWGISYDIESELSCKGINDSKHLFSIIEKDTMEPSLLAPPARTSSRKRTPGQAEVRIPSRSTSPNRRASGAWGKYAYVPRDDPPQK